MWVSNIENHQDSYGKKKKKSKADISYFQCISLLDYIDTGNPLPFFLLQITNTLSYFDDLELRNLIKKKTKTSYPSVLINQN